MTMTVCAIIANSTRIIDRPRYVNHASYNIVSHGSLPLLSCSLVPNAMTVGCNTYAIKTPIMDIIPLLGVTLKRRSKDPRHRNERDCNLQRCVEIVALPGEVFDEDEEGELREGDAEDVKEG
jgi:hypothetical protein